MFRPRRPIVVLIMVFTFVISLNDSFMTAKAYDGSDLYQIMQERFEAGGHEVIEDIKESKLLPLPEPLPLPILIPDEPPPGGLPAITSIIAQSMQDRFEAGGYEVSDDTNSPQWKPVFDVPLILTLNMLIPEGSPITDPQLWKNRMREIWFAEMD